MPGTTSLGKRTPAARPDDARYVAQRAAMRFDPTSRGTSAIPAAADTGQAFTQFASPTAPAPLSIVGGVITHTPFAGTQSAGYLQVAMPGRVRRVGAMVSWPVNALGVFACVIPSAPWSSGVLPNAGFHLSINGNGIWTLIRFTTGGSTTLASSSTHGRFNSTLWGTGLAAFDFWIDPDNQRATLLWPDGTMSKISSPYFASETANYAVWELFENNNGDVAASIGAIWADTAAYTVDAPELTSYLLSQQVDRSPAAPYNVSGTLNPDLSKTSIHLATLVGNITSFTFANPVSQRQEIEVHFIQDATGSRTLTGVSSTIKWAGGASPTLTTTANRRDIFRFRYWGGTYYETSRSMNVG